MRSTTKTTLLVVLLVCVIAGTTNAGLVKVPKRYNVIDFIGGYSLPVGKYDGLAGFVDFENQAGRPVDIDADRLYDPSYHFGFNYGQIRNNHILFSVGFRFTHIDHISLAAATVEDLAPDMEPGDALTISGYQMFFEPKKPSVNMYDLDFNLNYLFSNVTEFPVAPYAGVGVTGGLTAATAKGYDSESRIEVLARVNFGLEFKFWQAASKRSFLTVASINSYDFVASGDRPRHLYLGGALKYYFRP